jgi:hypothetical protein
VIGYFESVPWFLLGLQKSYVIMQSRIFRESEILAFNRKRNEAVNLVDHLQNWIDGVAPLITKEPNFFETQLGVCLAEFWPNLQFVVFSVLGGAYFDALRNLRFSLESVLVSLSGVMAAGERPNYYRIIDSLAPFSEAERGRIKALYGRLSQMAHPSTIHLGKILEDPSRAFVLFYDPELFSECCSFVDEVAGMVFSIILERYPHVREKATHERFFYESLNRLPYASKRL